MPKAYNHVPRPLDVRKAPSGTVVLVSWSNLELMLRSAGTIRPSETGVAFYASDDGLYVEIERNG